MPLHTDVAAELRRQILSGELAVGAPLPSEARLCEMWHTSRTPVRQALAALRAEGLIGGGRGTPPVVRARLLTQPFDSFLSFTRWARDLGREPGQRAVEVVRCPAHLDLADALGIDVGDPVVHVLRVRLVDGEPVMLERLCFTLEAGLPLLTADLDTRSVYDTLRAAGLEPASAHHTFDAVAADETDAELLGVPVGSPLLRERRHARLASGAVVEYSDDRYRPDVVTFAVNNAQDARSPVTRAWHSPDRHVAQITTHRKAARDARLRRVAPGRQPDVFATEETS